MAHFRLNFIRSLLAAGLTAAALGSAAAADIKIGVAEALSGPAGQYGQSIKNGFVLAADEINAAGGINGNKLNLLFEDEAGKKEQAIDVFKKLIFQDKVLMLFGPTLSNSAQAADPIAQGAKIVVFGTSNTADGITSIGDYVFRNSVTEADVLPETLRVAIKHAGIKKVAVMYGNDDVFTKSGYDNFKKALEKLNIPVTTTETFAKGDVDFKAQLTKIKGSGADAIVLSALIAEGAPIMVQARQLGIDWPVIGGNGMNSVKVFDLAKGASDNLWVGSPWALGNETKENMAFIDAYKKKFGAAPDQFAAQAFDAMHIAAGDRLDQSRHRRRREPQGAARRAAQCEPHRRHRPVQVPADDGPRRQAGRLRRAAGGDRFCHEGRQVCDREVMAGGVTL